MGWSLYALARESRNLQWRWRHQAWHADEPFHWRPGTPPTERFRGFMAMADGFIDEPGVIAFSSLQRDHDALVLWLWASYSLPHHTVRPAHGADLLEQSRWWISWNTALDEHPHGDRLDKVLHTEDGVLYRILP